MYLEGVAVDDARLARDAGEGQCGRHERDSERDGGQPPSWAQRGPRLGPERLHGGLVGEDADDVSPWIRRAALAAVLLDQLENHVPTLVGRSSVARNFHAEFRPADHDVTIV